MLASQLMHLIVCKHGLLWVNKGSSDTSRLSTHGTNVIAQLLSWKTIFRVISNGGCHSISTNLDEIATKHTRKSMSTCHSSYPLVNLPKIQSITQAQDTSLHQISFCREQCTKTKEHQHDNNITNDTHHKGCVIDNSIPLVHHTWRHGFQWFSWCLVDN